MPKIRGGNGFHSNQFTQKVGRGNQKQLKERKRRNGWHANPNKREGGQKKQE